MQETEGGKEGGGEREREKEDDLDVVLSPQRQSFAGGCHVTNAVGPQHSGSPLEKDSAELRLLGGRRVDKDNFCYIFEKDQHLSGKDLQDLRDRDKDKCFRREFRDSKRVFGEHRRNDSYTEKEPEWFSAVSMKP